MKGRAIALLAALGGSMPLAARADPPPAADPAATLGTARLELPLGGTFARREGVVDDPLVRGGIDDRPYLARLGSASTHLAIGGYLDMLGSYVREQGTSDGFSFEMRRFNIFITSRIADRIRLTSELELEHGAAEIALETALVDLLFHHAVNLRAGILLAPIGKFNIAHDSPLYDVVDRPLVSTMIIPATLSLLGGGFFGAFYPGGGNKLTYEIYVANGLGDGIVSGSGTRIPGGRSETAFAKSNSGVPSVVGRVAFVSSARKKLSGELGFSTFAGIYNTFRKEGRTVDAARWVRIVAIDGELAAGPLKLRGEAAFANVDLPPSLTPLHARQQVGFYAEASCPFFERAIGPFRQASLGAVARLDYVDLHLGPIGAMGSPAGDKTTRVTVGPWFRPAPGTSLRFVYFHDWIRDVLDNATPGGGVEVGLATYY